jgi:hypothetical protein
VAARSGRTNIQAQIEHQTELLQNETDWARGVFCENASEIRCIRILPSQKSATWKCATQEARFGEIRNARLKPEYRPLRTSMIDSQVRERSFFEIPTSDLEFFQNYSAALNAAQR